MFRFLDSSTQGAAKRSKDKERVRGAFEIKLVGVEEGARSEEGPPSAPRALFPGCL